MLCKFIVHNFIFPTHFSEKGAQKKRQDDKKKQTGTKILVRNIPFEAKNKEVRELFRYAHSDTSPHDLDLWLMTLPIECDIDMVQADRHVKCHVRTSNWSIVRGHTDTWEMKSHRRDLGHCNTEFESWILPSLKFESQILIPSQFEI